MAFTFPAIPAAFVNAEAVLTHNATVIESFLQTRSLPYLQKLDAALKAGVALPFGLDAYKVQVETFLDDAIALALDIVETANLLAHFTAVAAVPVG